MIDYILITVVVVILAKVVTKMFFYKAKDMENQVVLITGGANGLGKEIAIQLSKRGCKIAIADLDMVNAEKTVQEILAGGCKEARAYKVDVSQLSDIETLRTKLTKDLGGVDIIINNAAILFIRPVDEESPEVLTKMMNVNVMSLIWTTRVFLKDFIEQKRGHIISISSLAGLVGPPDLHLYCTTKFAVRGFMEALYIDLYRNGLDKYVKTTTVFPFFINTGKTVTEHTGSNYRYTKIFNTKTVAKRIVRGIRYDERIVTIPGIAFLFGYKIQIPLFLTKMYIKHMTLPKKT